MQYSEIAISAITVPANRQRVDAKPDAAFVDDIRTNGLLNPIVVHMAPGGGFTLVAGERRLNAHRELKAEKIRATILELLPPYVAHRIELAENLQRKQLSWQEETKAVADYHAMRQEMVGAMWTQKGTATELGVSDAQVSKLLIVAKSLDDEQVRGCPSLQGAFNLIQGRAERAVAAAEARGINVASATVLALPPQFNIGASPKERTAAVLASMKLGNDLEVIAQTVDPAALVEAGAVASAALKAEEARLNVSDLVINADFLEWAADYSGPKFDVLHIDFPYGKGYKGSNTRRTGKAHINPTYLDDPDIYFELVDGLMSVQDNIAFPVAHCLFWFDMAYYQWTVERFKDGGWSLVQPFPLIWTKGYTGVAADPKRRPRHCYETALLFSRGDRKIVKLDNDHGDCPLEETKLHMSQKPIDILKKFLGIIVDENTAVLDPTCGSGSALAAALQLRAARVLGVELDSTNADVARFLLQRKAPNDVSSA